MSDREWNDAEYLNDKIDEIFKKWECGCAIEGEIIVYEPAPKEWVYCMSNPSMPDIYKIGMTRRTPEERLYEANMSDTFRPPTPYEILYSVETTDGIEKEKLLHSILNDYRVVNNREFFKVEKEKIKELFDLIRVRNVCKNVVNNEEDDTDDFKIIKNVFRPKCKEEVNNNKPEEWYVDGVGYIKFWDRAKKEWIILGPQNTRIGVPRQDGGIDFDTDEEEEHYKRVVA